MLFLGWCVHFIYNMYDLSWKFVLWIIELWVRSCDSTYRKVGSTSLSRLKTHAGFFRLSLKGNFDVCLLGTFGKKNDFHIIKANIGSSCLMQISLVQISLLQFFKTFLKYLVYAVLGPFIYFINVIFWQKIGKKLH